MLKVEPCPLCGSKNVVYDNDTGADDNGYWCWIACNTCGFRTPDCANDSEAFKEWNRIRMKVSELVTSAKREECERWSAQIGLGGYNDRLQKQIVFIGDTEIQVDYAVVPEIENTLRLLRGQCLAPTSSPNPEE